MLWDCVCQRYQQCCDSLLPWMHPKGLAERSEASEDDWGKLRWALQYLLGPLYLKLTLKVEDLSTIKWYVDASYTVHPDCKGHTGAVMTLGKGAITSTSTKQKVNVQSSTEGELVGADDALPQAIWSKYFIEAQGHTVENNIMFQDNKSCMLLETRMENSRAQNARSTLTTNISSLATRSLRGTCS